MPKRTKTPARRRSTPPSPTGWTITPKSIGMALSTIALIAALVKPIEVGMQLSTSIDKLSTAVTQLQTVMKEQGEDITLLKSKAAGMEALKDARDRQLLSIESRLQQLELGKH